MVCPKPLRAVLMTIAAVTVGSSVGSGAAQAAGGPGFLSHQALYELSLVKSRGANAVVDIVSYYKKNEFKSATNYECWAGTFVAGVALKGTYAKVK